MHILVLPEKLKCMGEELKGREQEIGYVYVLTANPGGSYSESQPSSAGSRNRALRDKTALSMNVFFLLMGMDCKDAFVFAFMSSQTICSSQRRVHNLHISGNTYTVLSSTSH